MSGKTPFLNFDNFGQMNVTTGICSAIYCKTVGSMKSLNVAFEFEVKSPRYIKSNAFPVSCRNTFYEDFLVKTTRSRPLLLFLLNPPF